MHVVIFEGSQWPSFAPFSLSRPVFSLPCGAGTLLEKQVRATRPTRLTLWVRPELENFCRRFILPTLPCPTEINTPLSDEPTLLLSGRTLHLSHFEHHDSPYAVIDPGTDGAVIRQAFVHEPGLSPSDVLNRTDRWLHLLNLPHTMPQSRLPQYVWDLINWNEEAIVADFIASIVPSQEKPAGAYHVIASENIWIGSDVKLGPGCVLDGSRGPIILGEQASVGANAVIQGPCYIGLRTQIMPLSFVRHGCSFGTTCKIGGEISNSIFVGFANKSHDGFIGDSYIGEWANLGAGTTTSNLKNTYGEVNMRINGEQVKSGRRFLGSLVGDHVKTAIGTRLMTGSYIGYAALLATSGFPPRFVPSFSFLTDDGLEPYRLDKLAESMKAIFHRRNRNWTSEDETMNQYVSQTAKSVEQ